MNTINNIVVNADTKRRIEHLATLRNKSFDEMAAVLLENGVKDACYRMKRNQEKWAQMKAAREAAKGDAEKMARLEQLLRDNGINVDEL